ncbi:MAG: GatB/YqeY domain-containing protein [Chloroflexota bacterium]|nr:GatB/YqeY domain-containing protein [Chloroflexota bacterium]
MSLKEKLRSDLYEASKKGEKVRLGAIRLVLAGVKNAEIAQGGELDDAGVLTVLAKEVRQHRESIAEFKKGNRMDLVVKEEAELLALQVYMLQQLSREEIVQAARQVIADVGAKGPTDKGKVMSRLMPQLKGKADGRDINEVVTELLASG